MVFDYTPTNIANLESSHSPERLAPYYALAGGDKELGPSYTHGTVLCHRRFTPPCRGWK